MTLPTPNHGFHWVSEPWGPLLRCAPLERVARHGFTSRQLELRAGERTGSAWTHACASVGCVPQRMARITQVHGAQVRVVRAQDALDETPDADAAITAEAGRAVAVVAADCVPILLADARTGAVGAVHAGWRGTAANVVGAAVAAMTSAFRTSPRDLVAAIGPSIGPCCYTVGRELITAFEAAGHSRQRLDRWFSARDQPLVLDLWTATEDLLVDAGLERDHVHLAGLCTQTHRAVFESFRADGAAAGRMAAIILARDEPGIRGPIEPLAPSR